MRLLDEHLHFSNDAVTVEIEDQNVSDTRAKRIRRFRSGLEHEVAAVQLRSELELRSRWDEFDA